MASKGTDYEYLVVGAGLSGCVVAYRLSHAGFRVLLLEAGRDPSDNPDVTTPLGGFALVGSDLDYGYKTTPQESTFDRVHTLAAGKALGGGSTINFGGWLRGDAKDYDAWSAAVGGDERWSYRGLLPWFQKSESFHDKHGKNAAYHGFDGRMQVTSISASDPQRIYPLREPIRHAWQELGVGVNDDPESVSGLSEFHENSKAGCRQPAHLAYPLSEVEVVTDAVVARVNFDGNSARGVELVDGRQFAASREVILCAGAYRTPQLLLLSGIGPSTTLNKHTIPVVHDLPGVGENLHDHFALYMAFRLKDPERGLALGKLENPAFFKGLPYDWVVNELDKPANVQNAIKTEAATNPFADSLLKFPRPLVENFTVYAPAGIPGIPFDGTHVASSTMILTPTSRGSVSISSRSPTDQPVIDPKYLSTEVDRTALAYASRRMLNAMLTTSALSGYIEAETPPAGPGLEGLEPLTRSSSDAEILDRIKRTGQQHYHSGGTAAMGSVVDNEGRVIGVSRLRVVDASVIPAPVAGHPQATLYAVAEQLAAMIIASA